MPYLPVGRKRGGRSQPAKPVMSIADESTLRRSARRVLKIAPDAFCLSVPCCPANDNNQPLLDKQCDGDGVGNQNNSHRDPKGWICPSGHFAANHAGERHTRTWCSV